MIYFERPPIVELKEFIQCFWIMQTDPLNSNEVKEHSVLPDCCADIIFDFTRIRQHSPAYVVGTMTRPLFFTTSNITDMIGIRFRPGGIRAFIETSLDQCTDLAADLSCFWGQSGSELWEQLGHHRQIDERISLIESYLIKKYNSQIGIDPYVRQSIKIIENSFGTIRVKELELADNLGIRQLERKFKKEIGVGPKEFARLVRFQNIIKMARLSPFPDWDDIAYFHGHADQSHLIREFKEFSGVTPTAFVAGNQ